MACVTHHNWLNLSNMVSEKRFPLSSSYRLEKVFPVYAMGLPDPDPESILDGSDPIWEAVKHEAKLEVHSFFFLLLYCFIKMRQTSQCSFCKIIVAHDDGDSTLVFCFVIQTVNLQCSFCKIMWLCVVLTNTP